MPDLTDFPRLPGLPGLPDLARDVRERAVPPPYEQVGRRVRAHRRRLAAGVLAATVLVVGGVGVAQTLGGHERSAAPRPAEHGPLPATDETLWRAVVDGTDSHPFEISGSDDGSVAVVWRALEPGTPTFALVIRDADGAVHGIRLVEPVALTPVPGGWVGVRGTRGWLIGTDGSWRDLVEAGSAREPKPGDVYVRGQYASFLYSPQDRTWSWVPQTYANIYDGYVTPAGHLVTCGGDGRGTLSVTVGEERQSPDIPGATCEMTGRGDTIAVAGLGDGADGGIPLTGLLVTTDGQTFSRGDFLPLGGVTSLAITPAGSTIVTDASTGSAFVLSADGSSLVDTDRRLGLAFVAGDHLYATSYGFMNGPLLVSDDDGATWHEDVLPGNESSGQ